jgi:hypothetical protein
VAVKCMNVMQFLCRGSLGPDSMLTIQIYCTVIFNLALGVTCDFSTKLYLPAELDTTCDQPKILADSIFGGVVLPRREEIFIFILL